MYLDAQIELFQVTKNLYNVTLRVYGEDGNEIKFKEWERVSWSNAVGLARAAYLSARATQGAKAARAANEGKAVIQEELPFDNEESC